MSRVLISKALFGAGIVVAISGAAKVPSASSDWPDSWPIFVLGVAVAAVGLTLWRIALASARKTARGETRPADQDAARLLADCLPPLRALREAQDTLSAQQLCDRVDEILNQYLLPLAEVRQQLIDRLGMQAGAEILVTVAFGERMLNRVWSAAADGHLPEARACLPDAVAAIEEAGALLP